MKTEELTALNRELREALIEVNGGSIPEIIARFMAEHFFNDVPNAMMFLMGMVETMTVESHELSLTAFDTLRRAIIKDGETETEAAERAAQLLQDEHKQYHHDSEDGSPS